MRHLNAAESRKLPIVEVNLAAALAGLKLTHEQFIDLCILCGCDYTDSIKGIGPIKALKMIQDYGNIEGVLKALDTKKYQLPEPFPFEEARALFVQPDAIDPESIELKWNEVRRRLARLCHIQLPARALTLLACARCRRQFLMCGPSCDAHQVDAEGLRKYLVEEKQFSEERINKAIERLQKCKGKNSQVRLESFFGPSTVIPSSKKLAAKTLGKSKGKQTGGNAAKKQKK